MRIFRGGLLAAAGMFIAYGAQAQYVPLSRCGAALPCSIPFNIQYRPDPLIAAQYGKVSNTGMAVSIPLEFPLHPQLATRATPDLGTALDNAIRQSIHMKGSARKGAIAPLNPADALPPGKAPSAEAASSEHSPER